MHKGTTRQTKRRQKRRNNRNTMQIMKKCPHCDGAAALTQNYNYRQRQYFVFVKCLVCGAQGKSYTSETEPAADEWSNESCYLAVEAWNMRTGGGEE